MKNFSASTASQNLINLKWNAVSIATSNAWQKISAILPSFTINTLTSVLSGGPMASIYRFAITGGGVVPAWVMPGTAVTVSGTITSSGADSFSGSYTVRDVATDGTSFDVVANGNITASLVAVAITNGSVKPILQCQKAMLTLPSTAASSVSFSPNCDANSNPIWVQTVTAGGDEYEITSPTCSPLSTKFDLSDWWVKSASATPSLTIRFI